MSPFRSRHDREIAVLAIPALGSLVADPLLSLVDTAFVGRIGTEALGALGVASALFAVAFFAFNFLEYGTTTVVARAFGAGDIAAGGRATVTALALAMSAGTMVGILLLVAAGPAVRAMGAEGGVAAAAVGYVMVRAMAAPAVLVVRAAHGAFRGFQDTRTPFLVSLGINAINLALDPILIFGLGWGVQGAAWATVTAQWIGAAWFVAIFVRRRHRYGITPTVPAPGEVRAFLTVGRDLAIRTAALLATFTLATAVAARVSEAAIAAHQILMQVFLFLALALDALAIAAQALVGRHLGAGRRESAAEVADRLLILGLGFGVLAGALLIGLGPALPGWFGSEPAVRDAVVGVLWMVALVQPLAAIVFVWDGVFIGAGDFTYLAGAMLLSAAISSVVLVGVLPLGWGLSGVWAGLLVLLVARAITLAWRRMGSRGPLRPPA